MPDAPLNLRSLILGPGLCVLVLGAMALEARDYITERDTEPFHQKAKAAIDRIPLVIPPWMGREIPLGADEQRILAPNAYRCVEFADMQPSGLADPSRRVLLMVAQCRRTGQMIGHYPPECYPARGYMPTGEDKPRSWDVDGKTIIGTEYAFEKTHEGRVARTTVYNFMVLPDQGVRADMKAINESAEDYKQRYYGAAQFQVVFAGQLAEAGHRAERDAVFTQIMRPCLGVIETLSDGATENE